MNDMTSSPSIWREIRRKFTKCLRDEGGSAMTEYILIMMLVVLPAIFYLFNPDNGFYKGIRDQYELTTTMLMFPGP
jgi:Flp pilus assembly pilin Flp